jgi:hypothetical protein
LSIGCCIVLLAGCTTTPPLTVDGAPVSGDARALSIPDIQAAVAAMRADLPQIRAQQLTAIEVIDSNTVHLSYLEPGERFPTKHVVKRARRRWHYTWEIVVGRQTLTINAATGTLRSADV